MNAAYYNEINPHAAEWLRHLAAAGLIPAGDVDERSIEDVSPDDLRGYTSCHFFAGVGGWAYALREAGWPDDKQVWSGSCPCQPYSAAGLGLGDADERNLWPAWHWLLSQCRPPVVFGEQVAHRRTDAWIDTVSTDMEALDYRIGAVAFPAALVGAPHRRERIYFVADAEGGEQCRAWERSPGEAGSDRGRGPAPGPVNGHWSDAEWLECGDGRSRPAKPGTHPLAHGAAARVERLGGYGNAIVVPAAAAFIQAYIEGVAE